MICDWTSLVAAHSELAHIPQALRAAAHLRVCAAGETLFRQGDRPKAMFCLIDGEVRLLRRSREGAEVVLQRSRGGFFAEASLESKAYHCGAEARILHAIESEGTAGTLTLAQSRKAWAAELGLTHEALYRALARLQAAGTLALDGGRMTLRQPGKRL